MAVDLMNPCRNNDFVSKIDENAVKKAAVAGLQSLENLIGILSDHPHLAAGAGASSTTDYIAVADAAVTKFKKFISLLDRTCTGHARFRRGPLSNPAFSPAKEILSSPAPVQHRPTPIPFPKTGSFGRKDVPSTTINFAAAAAAAAAASPASSFMSSLTGDTDGFQITNLSQASSAVRPNLSSSSFKMKCNSMDDSHTKCTSSSGRCHCSKKRKLKMMKRVVRVPAISLKMADIPPDDYSWRKYGQKPIKGSPHPRGYYKCSSLRGCPARKKVERALDDPTMLIVTYESDHNHSQNVKDSSATVILESS